MKVSVSKAARIISNVSGVRMTRKSLINQVMRGRWPYKIYLPDPNIYSHRLFLMEDSDAVSYAKTYNGFKRGRPSEDSSAYLASTIDVLQSLVDSYTPR